MKPVLPLEPRTLTGRFVVLEPLEGRHHADLIRAAADPAIWTYIPLDMTQGYAARLGWFVEEMAKGTQLTYAVRRLSDGAVVGSTSYLAITPKDAKLEVGATWYVAGARGTAVNPEAKYLLLENAFGAGYNRIEFKTDSKNLRSRAALKKLGAIEEGTLRGHMWMPQGYFRDSVYFSILAAEWPKVKAALERRLAV
ncbi:MAG: GNAT family N-acetyltransferase [Alphaproteobacteria bacterium]|nr:GNAT family N-acetyltransferase [Alphaproteobacteria bacterium]MDE1987484.1 GNAT family N-acetyltransferase [Alphaproteobacteria bacterium]MDE2162426.1 GNAT family N-acetyltransferase [Alphaproteobacteria bacterium]